MWKGFLNYLKFCLGCPFIAVDKSSFKEYIDVLGEWVTSDCPNNYMYSAKQCKCILQGTTPLNLCFK